MTMHHNAEPFLSKSLVYDTLDFTFQDVVAEKQSAEYDAYTFRLNGLNVLFRSAKITPKKTGQFVTLWKRLGNGPIMPFDAADPIDLVVVSVKTATHYGQFIFPKDILLKRSIFTTACKDGKRAIRVYPLWDVTENAQAKRTQKWQLDYFVDLSLSKDFDEERIRNLYSV